MTPLDTYLVLGSNPWNQATFERRLRGLPGDWIYLDDPGALTMERMDVLRPRMLFFLHWSWMVPSPIVEGFECVCFHMTDLPYGRGGTPLQNLLLRGQKETMLTAFRMTAQLDAGPVYMKMPLSLEGRAQDIYQRASDLSAEMIERLLATPIDPHPQTGEVVVFTRRRPEESALPEHLGTLEEVHDFIRMLDADGYPRAYLEWGSLRLEFHHSRLRPDLLEALVTIRLPAEEGD